MFPWSKFFFRLSPFLPSLAAPALEGTSHPLSPCLLMCTLAQDGSCCCNYCYSSFQQHLNSSKQDNWCSLVWQWHWLTGPLCNVRGRVKLPRVFICCSPRLLAASSSSLPWMWIFHKPVLYNDHSRQRFLCFFCVSLSMFVMYYSFYGHLCVISSINNILKSLSYLVYRS